MAERYSSKTLRETVRVIAGRFWGMLLILVIVVGGVTAVTLLAPKTYRTEAHLIARPGRNTNPLQETAPLRYELVLFVTTQRQIITSDYVLATAMMMLDGRNLPKLDFALGDDLAQRKARSEALAKASERRREMVTEFVQANPELMRKLRKRVQVLTPGGPDATFSQTFWIRVDWPEEAGLAAEKGEDVRQFAVHRTWEFTKHLVQAYEDRFTMLESQRTQKATDFLKRQAAMEARNEFLEASHAYESFIKNQAKGDLPLVMSMSGTLSTAGGELSETVLLRQRKDDLMKIGDRVARVEALKTAIDQELAKQDDRQLVVPDMVLQDNATMQALQAKIVDLKLMVNALEPRYSSNYSELRSARKELGLSLEDLREQLRKQADALDIELKMLRASQEVLSRDSERTEQRIASLAPLVPEYERLVAELKAAQTNYDEQKKRGLDAATAERLAENPVLVTLLDQPYMPDPDSPVRPILWLNIAVSILAGLVLAFVYAFLSDHFDHSLKSIDEAERYLGTPVLGSVPKMGGNIVRT